MRWEIVCLVLGWTIGLVTIPLIVVAIFSFITEGFEDAVRTFAIPLIVSIISGYALVSLSGADDASSRVRDREAFASVALGWIPVVIVGALPFWFGGMFYGPFGAYWASGSDYSASEVLLGLLHSWFESMSGFTTTGASLIDSSTSPICGDAFEGDCVSSQRQSLILWRSMSQWLGGMGAVSYTHLTLPTKA